MNALSLLISRSFLPLFVTQFLGALNDNIFKNALVIYITYKLSSAYDNSQIMITVSALLFILPFFLFSALAGQVADKYNRAKVARVLKAVEVAIMILASIAFYVNDIYLLFFALFLMGAQSSFFGPVKYAIIPQLMSKDEIVAANGLISGATFVAILFGTIVGGLLILNESGVAAISILTIFCAIFGYFSSLLIPNQPAAGKLQIKYNIFSQTWQIMKMASNNITVFVAIIGVSWFWFIGATFLTQFPNYVSNIIYANNEVVTFFLTIFSVAIAVGSLTCNILLKGRASTVLAPISLLLISIFTADLFFATIAYKPLIGKVVMLNFYDFLASKGSYRIIIDLFFIAFFCGIYVVPLYSIIQILSVNSNRSRVIAALNVFDSAFMVTSALLVIALYWLGFNSIQIFFGLAMVNLLFLVFTYQFFYNRDEN